MAKYLIASTTILPDLPVKIDHSNSIPDSPRPSIDEQYFTPRSSITNDKTSSDSSSTLTDHSSNEEADYGDFVNTSVKKHVRFSLSTASTTKTVVKIQDNEAEFFAVIPYENPNNNINNQKTKVTKTRKRDKIRSMFHKKHSQTNGSDTSDNGTHEWDEMLAKSLITIHQDIHEIITGIDQIDQPTTDYSVSTALEKTITNPRLSFRERQRAKLEMMRMSQILHPPNLLTYDIKESPYPYTDIVAPHNYNLLRLKKQIPLENLLIQHKPIRHEKLRYRTQRCLLKMQRDLKHLKRNVYGKSSSKTHQELPSFNVQNYRTRLEKTLREVRTQIAEYDRIHSAMRDHRQSISQIIAKMKVMDPTLKAQIEDYRTKLRPIEYIDDKRKNDLISAPFIPRRARPPRPGDIKKETNDRLIDTRFDPTTFIDLNKEAEEFFGNDLPFWDESAEPISYILSPAIRRRQTTQFTLPPKTGIWDRFVYTFKTKQKNLRNGESIENDGKFFDCNSPRSQSLIYPSNEQSSNELESVEF